MLQQLLQLSELSSGADGWQLESLISTVLEWHLGPFFGGGEEVSNNNNNW